MEDKNIIIVGGSSGIGLALSKELVKEGNKPIIISRNNNETLKEMGLQHFSWDAQNPIGDHLENLPEIVHGLVYCPGTINLKPFQRFSEEEFQHDFEINVKGAIRILQHRMKALRKAKGASVVLFSTVASRLGMNFHSSIATAKSAVEGLTKSLAAEWAMHNIRVNAIAPSLTDTPLAEKLLSSEDRREASAKRHPISRVGKAEDIAELANFLLSDRSSWMTGQIIGVDGGMGALKP